MTFLRRKTTHDPTPSTDDIELARSIRQEVTDRQPAVQRMTMFLVERRRANNFGDELEVTWTPSVRTNRTPKPRQA